MQRFKPFDIVALVADVPESGLKCGQVGTIVAELGPDSYEVELADEEGRTYASLGLKGSQLLLSSTLSGTKSAPPTNL